VARRCAARPCDRAAAADPPEGSRCLGVTGDDQRLAVIDEANGDQRDIVSVEDVEQDIAHTTMHEQRRVVATQTSRSSWPWPSPGAST
jgi:hypothetical protein